MRVAWNYSRRVTSASWGEDRRVCDAKKMKNPQSTHRAVLRKSNHGDGDTQADEYISDIAQCSS